MDKNKKMYELGYLLSPIIPEDKLDEEISSLRKVIEDQKGLIMNEGRAKMRTLAYTIKKPRAGNYDNAYFGWIRFLVDVDSISEIKSSFNKNTNLIRFLIVELIKESAKKPSKKKLLKRKIAQPVEAAEKMEIKPEEIDKKIEELIGNNTN